MPTNNITGGIAGRDQNNNFTYLPNLKTGPRDNLPQTADNPSFAKKIMEKVPPYLMGRIFANINVIHSLIMGGGWHEEQFKTLLKDEIHKLTENLKDPALQESISELTDAANVPVSFFIKKLTDIIQKHIADITYKLGSLLGNAAGEIPILNVPINAALAVSNGMHVVKNFTDIGKELLQNIQTFKNEMTTVMEKFNASPGQYVPQQTGQYVEQQTRQYGGSKLYNPHNIKEVKKHLRHFKHKKNRTLKRIHHSIQQLLSSDNKRHTIKTRARY